MTKSPMADVEFQYNCLLCGMLRLYVNITEGEMDYNPLDRDVKPRFYCIHYDRFVDGLAVERYNEISRFPVLPKMQYKNNWKFDGGWKLMNIEPYQSPYPEYLTHYQMVFHALKDAAKECDVYLANITRCGKKCGECSAYKRKQNKCVSPAARARRTLLKGRV